MYGMDEYHEPWVKAKSHENHMNFFPSRFTGITVFMKRPGRVSEKFESDSTIYLGASQVAPTPTSMAKEWQKRTTHLKALQSVQDVSASIEFGSIFTFEALLEPLQKVNALAIVDENFE